jgi:hypothetical protein
LEIDIILQRPSYDWKGGGIVDKLYGTLLEKDFNIVTRT